MIVILYDGECSFCSATIQFVLKRDREELFHFASIQSEAGRRLLRDHGVDEPELDTMYLLEHEQLHERSTAALRVARRLPFYSIPAGLVLCVPRIMRDWCYDMTARHRHRLLQKGSCLVPTEKQRMRLLDREEKSS